MAYEGMAILYRTNAQSRPLEEAFRFRGIPYRLIGGDQLLRAARGQGSPGLPAADRQSGRRRGVSPGGQRPPARHRRRLTCPARPGRGGVAEAVARSRTPGWQRERPAPERREALTGVAALLDRLREAVGQADPATALETILATTGYEQYLAEEGAEGMERTRTCASWSLARPPGRRCRIPISARAPVLRSSVPHPGGAHQPGGRG